MPQDRNRFDGVNDFFSEFSRVRTYGLRGGAEPEAPSAERTYASAWVPATDILADGDDLVIRIELPGIDPDDIDLRLTRGILTVSGTRDAAGEPADAYLSRERYRGEFRRSIALPEGTTADQISAEFHNGLVELRATGCATSEEGDAIALTGRTSPPPTKRRVRGD